jgi:hypothetical protein
MTPEEIERLKAIEEAATAVVTEITESKKLGQFISSEWIRLRLDDALKGKKRDPRL